MLVLSHVRWNGVAEGNLFGVESLVLEGTEKLYEEGSVRYVEGEIETFVEVETYEVETELSFVEIVLGVICGAVIDLSQLVFWEQETVHVYLSCYYHSLSQPFHPWSF